MENTASKIENSPETAGEKRRAHPFKHLSVVTKHRSAVFVHCVRAGIPWRGFWHDVSKLSPQEFIPSMKHFAGTRSPNELERADYGYSLAWMHHKGRNRHHFEYWVDYVLLPEGKITYAGNPMPMKYVAEMFCDRIAASRVYQGENYTDDKPYEYFMNARDDIDGLMHPDTARELETMLTVLKEKGEDAAFAYVRRRLRRDRRRRGAGLLLHHRGELT